MAPRRNSTAEGPYSTLAETYDLVYSWKDYAKESKNIVRWIQRWGPKGARTLLDVACGTGNHLVYLRKRFDCTGIDLNPAMLRVARRKLPGVRLRRGPMQSFDLHREYDVVTCLFSAIGYVRNLSEFNQTIRNLAHHVKPGGIVIVEPWVFPSDFIPGKAHAVLGKAPGVWIVRANVSTVKGRVSKMRFHYLLARDGAKRVRYWSVDHRSFGVTPAEYRTAFRRAGLSVRYVREGLTGTRGAFLGVKTG
jgi:ubiquinone/menaquinone biosynthesis C-methylase UbiE